MKQVTRVGSPRDSIRVVSLVQAETVTGPMKPLLMFAKTIQIAREDRARISQSVVTTVRARGRGPIGQNAFLEAAAESGVPVAVVRERFPLDPAIVPQIARHLASSRAHIVESHDFKSHFLIWLIGRTGALSGMRWLAFHHGYTKMSARVRAYQQLDRVSLPAADRVVTVCKPFVQQLVERGVDPHRIRILANAVENRARPGAADIPALKRHLGLLPEQTILLSVGRLSVEKGHNNLIVAFRSLEKRLAQRDLRLVLVGDGGEAQKLRAAAADLGNRVLFAGHIEDPWPYFCVADVFALPSYSEGSPLVLLEAMTAELPIVASAVGGIPEVLTDGVSALLIPPGDAESLTQSLERVLCDGDLSSRLRKAARASAAEYSPESYTQNRVSIYESLLGRGE